MVKLSATVLLVLAVAAAGALAAAGFFDRDAHSLFAASGPRAPVAALLFSGDMGLRFGMGPPTARALAAHGVPVLGVSSSTAFRAHRTRAETNGIVAQAVRDALRVTGQDRLVLVGQSFGADILQTGLAALPAALRRHIAGIILVVPGRDVFFRADPTALAYRGAPDSRAQSTLPTLDWAPLTCIYGKAEPDSACPGATQPSATIVAMPGGHFLHRDTAALISQILAAVRRAATSPHTE